VKLSTYLQGYLLRTSKSRSRGFGAASAGSQEVSAVRETKLLALLIVESFLLVHRAAADTFSVTVDPGAAGSSFSYQNFDFSTLVGSPYNGQTQLLDVWFGGQFLVAPEMAVEFFENQTGPLGTNPDLFGPITGVLLDADGAPVGKAFTLAQNVSMPAQVWPGWPYTLPDGEPFLPATTGYGMDLEGTAFPYPPGSLNTGDSYAFSIDPLEFSGIQFEITYPADRNASLLGSRLQLSSYEPYTGTSYTSPIYVSPNPVPSFVATPEVGSTATFLLLDVAVFSLAAFALRLKRL